MDMFVIFLAYHYVDKDILNVLGKYIILKNIYTKNPCYDLSSR